VRGSQRTQAVVRVANRWLGTLLGGHLDDKAASLNGVDEDEPRLEVRVRRPGTKEGNGSATLVLVILGVDIEKACLTDAGTRRVFGDTADVEHVQAVTVVGLVQVVVDNVLVVVDGSSLASIVSSVLGVLEVANVENVGGGETLGHRTNLGITLIELIVHEEILLPCLVVYNTLVNVLSAREVCNGNNVAEIPLLVGHIVDGQRIFIVAVTDILSVVSLVWTPVHKTFSIMNVPVG
jgi:hypothetical protein